jgi:hypothetical protein
MQRFGLSAPHDQVIEEITVSTRHRPVSQRGLTEKYSD